MKLNELSPSIGSSKSRKRVGRGVASGSGKTAGRGNKGHKARSGGGVKPGFEGGQMPIHRRLPKRGFNNIFRKEYAIVNLRDLSQFETGSIVDQTVLSQAGLVKGRYFGVKLLALGEIKQPLTIKVNKASNSAIQKVEAVGGKVEVI
ncbi:MAG: 50S ribosomal protein L15 [Desulfobacteraceae bacterium]|nr:MAG: 50S ribosomal protein L15 [Desulfobacteraceae bacterium]